MDLISWFWTLVISVFSSEDPTHPWNGVWNSTKITQQPSIRSLQSPTLAQTASPTFQPTKLQYAIENPTGKELYFYVHADWGKGGVDGKQANNRRLEELENTELIHEESVLYDHENVRYLQDQSSNQKNQNKNNNQNQNQQSNKNQNKKQNVFYQGDIARAMAATAASTKPSFIMALGDNFYANGVSSTTDATWKTFFRDVYFNNFDTLKGIPWHPAFGNHDLGYGYTGIQAQLDRTSQSADVNDDNGEWQFPAAYYTVKYNIPGGGFVQVIVVDTTTLAPSTTSFTSSQGGISTETQAMRIMEQLEGLLDIFQATLRNPPTWLLVMGHYQMFSYGSKGDNAELLTYLLPLLSHYGVHAYFCGHDHINEHLQHNGIEYFIAGASTMTSTLSSSPSSLATLKWAGESFAAFTRVTATAEKLSVDFLNVNSTVVYRYAQRKRIPSPPPTSRPSPEPTSVPSSAPTTTLAPTEQITQSFCERNPTYVMCINGRSYTSSYADSTDAVAVSPTSHWVRWVITAFIAIPCVPLSFCLWKFCYNKASPEQKWVKVNEEQECDEQLEHAAEMDSTQVQERQGLAAAGVLDEEQTSTHTHSRSDGEQDLRSV